LLQGRKEECENYKRIGEKRVSFVLNS
jgi:hypothetical protein